MNEQKNEQEISIWADLHLPSLPSESWQSFSKGWAPPGGLYLYLWSIQCQTTQSPIFMSAEKKENLTHQLIPGKLGNLDSNL